MLDDRLLWETESDDSDNCQNEEISVNLASVGARLVENEVAQQLPSVQTLHTTGISSVGSNESCSIKMIQMAAAMDKLTGENARLTREIFDLRAQLRTRPSESTKELSYKLDTLISHAEKTSAGVELIVSEQGFITDNALDSSFLVSSLESTTQDRDGLRATVRSQAGKMGVVTKKLGEKTRKVSELEAERGQTIERSEMIQELRMMEIRMMEIRMRIQQGLRKGSLSIWESKTNRYAIHRTTTRTPSGPTNYVTNSV